jgi:hypothetical protein
MGNDAKWNRHDAVQSYTPVFDNGSAGEREEASVNDRGSLRLGVNPAAYMVSLCEVRICYINSVKR